MEEEIELRQYWDMLRKHWKIVVILPLIAAITSGLISFYVLKPVYQASTTLIVGKKASDSANALGQMLDYNVLMANQQLAKTYATIAQSRTVEQNVIKDLNLPLTIDQFNGLISINPVTNTEVIEIKVTNTSPELATSIANTMAHEFSKAVIEIKKVDSVSIVDTAEIPGLPIKPNKKLNIGIAFFVGLIVAVGLVFLLEYLDNTIKTLSDIETVLGIPVLGVIPLAYKGKKRKSHLELSLITLEQNKSPISEAFRTLRTNVQFASVDSVTKKIVITSASPQEGKSTTVANLAVSMAQAGKSVLVMDADLRNPTQHKLFILDNVDGLSMALVEDQDYRDYIRETSVPGLMVLTSGPIPPNPAELVGSKRMTRLLEEVCEQFDIVLIDTPPIVAVTDAAILAQEADGVIMVLASGEVKKDYAKKAKELLDRVGAKILGAVHNKVEIKAGDNHYYNYYGSDNSKKKSKRI